MRWLSNMKAAGLSHWVLSQNEQSSIFYWYFSEFDRVYTGSCNLQETAALSLLYITKLTVSHVNERNTTLNCFTNSLSAVGQSLALIRAGGDTCSWTCSLHNKFIHTVNSVLCSWLWSSLVLLHFEFLLCANKSLAVWFKYFSVIFRLVSRLFFMSAAMIMVYSS